MVGIKGWNMPKKCIDCCLCEWNMGNGGKYDYFCISPNGLLFIGKEVANSNSKPDFCPLVEIKDNEDE